MKTVAKSGVCTFSFKTPSQSFINTWLKHGISHISRVQIYCKYTQQIHSKNSKYRLKLFVWMSARPVLWVHILAPASWDSLSLSLWSTRWFLNHKDLRTEDPLSQTPCTKLYHSSSSTASQHLSPAKMYSLFLHWFSDFLFLCWNCAAQTLFHLWEPFGHLN